MADDVSAWANFVECHYQMAKITQNVILDAVFNHGKSDIAYDYKLLGDVADEISVLPSFEAVKDYLASNASDKLRNLQQYLTTWNYAMIVERVFKAIDTYIADCEYAQQFEPNYIDYVDDQNDLSIFNKNGIFGK